jgi:hypothetical protein
MLSLVLKVRARIRATARYFYVGAYVRYVNEMTYEFQESIEENYIIFIFNYKFNKLSMQY